MDVRKEQLKGKDAYLPAEWLIGHLKFRGVSLPPKGWQLVCRQIDPRKMIINKNITVVMN